MDDDWAPDLRFASCALLKKTMKYLDKLLTSNSLPYPKNYSLDEDFTTIYTELLARLDDSQDSIRIEATNALRAFFETIDVHLIVLTICRKLGVILFMNT